METNGVALRTGAADQLKRSLRSMGIARAIAVPWGLIQVLAYEQDYPKGQKALGVVLVAVLALGTAIFWFAARRVKELASARRVAVASLTFDILVSMGFVLLLTFDPTSALWAILFITILEGAILFQFEGALAAWAAVTILYALREMWGSERYGYELLWNSITFRMGIGLIIALVAGLMARDLVRERRRLAEALDEVTAIDDMRSALVSTLAHDIRNPLTSIRGAHQLLLQKGRVVDEATSRQLLETAERQSERLQVMATDLLDLARLEQGRVDLDVEPVNLRAEVERCVSFFEGEMEVAIDIPGDLSVKADRARLHQIVTNLLSNAQTYGAPPFQVVGRADGDEVEIRFCDHGSGVAQAARSTLFDQFGTRSGKGSVGFGLSIVKAMAEAHGGSVSYEDNSPSGAIFTITLPT